MGSELRQFTRTSLGKLCYIKFLHPDTGKSFTAFFEDIGLGGMKISLPSKIGAIKVGTLLTVSEAPMMLSMPLSERCGRVVWCADKHFGVGFEETIAMHEDEVSTLAEAVNNF